MKGDRLPSARALAEFRDIFCDAHTEFALDRCPEHELARVLDGQASAELRRLVSLTDRRKLGAFFTPHELADRLAEPLRGARGKIVVVDTSCGAGDLLLAAARALAPAIQRATATVHLYGVDIVPEFVEVAAWRLELQRRVLNLDLEVRTRCGEGRSAPEAASATHVLLNPPFASVQSADDCAWAGGTVNGAADFLDHTVARLAPASRLSALLPDVLRSGARYRQWRRVMGESLDIEETTILGQFDQWADVDVFLLGAVRRAQPSAGGAPESWVQEASGPTVGSRFHVSVGPVVHFRAPDSGPRRPYLTAKDFPTWGTIRTVARDRRFIGRLHRGPFVVIPRTSRPEEPARARGAIVADHRQVAVDNHLLVLSPLDGGIDECHRLLAVLRSEAANAWLNRAIRCRHLTVGAIASLPWIDAGGSRHAG